MVEGDFKLFAKLDPEETGECTEEAWMEYMQRTHAGKEEKNKGKGDSWCRTLMFTLQRGRKSDAQLKAEEAARQAFLAEKLRDAEEVYEMLVQKDAADQVLRKPELVAAYDLDTEIFDRIDKNSDDEITLDEWINFFRMTHAVMEENEMGAGDEWLVNMNDELRYACMDKAEREAEAAAREIVVEENDRNPDR